MDAASCKRISYLFNKGWIEAGLSHASFRLSRCMGSVCRMTAEIHHNAPICDLSSVPAGLLPYIELRSRFNFEPSNDE